MLTLQQATDILSKANQSHVLDGFESLNADEQTSLLAQIESVDWPEVSRLVESHVLSLPSFNPPTQMSPAPWYERTGNAHREKFLAAYTHGESLIREGKVAAFMVAGGQGSRLGWDGPKGTFPASPLRKAPLFQIFAENILALSKKYNTTVPWYLMTSQVNDAETRAFFEQHNWFGLDPAQVKLFPQAMMPALDAKTGKVLMASRSSLALSPNGHGGSLKALWSSGAIDDMKKRGITQISYVQVDNPLVPMIDPLFIGLHDLDGAQMSSKAVRKAFAKEKVGCLCKADGRIQVIEYTNLPDELAEACNPDGSLTYQAGSIALHAIQREFVESLNSSDQGFSLPWNRADKKVPYFDGTQNISPVEPNAVKLETFVFDALPLAEKSIILEVLREDEFGPIKNADAEGVSWRNLQDSVDSPATAIRLQIERAARWIEDAGVSVPRDGEGAVNATLEISPLRALEPDDLKSSDLPASIAAESEILLT